MRKENEQKRNVVLVVGSVESRHCVWLRANERHLFEARAQLGGRAFVFVDALEHVRTLKQLTIERSAMDEVAEK